MPDTLGSIIDYELSGKSAPNATPESASGNQERVSEPEVINGYDAESPATERFTSGSDNVKRTKSGGIDRRTLRGRKSDTETGTKDKVRLTGEFIADMLMGIHAMGASILKTPEIALEKPEATQLGKSLQDLAAAYDHVVNPKTAAWIQLCIVTGAIYGPRVAAIRMREKTERDLRKIKLTEHTTNGAPVYGMPNLPGGEFERDN